LIFWAANIIIKTDAPKGLSGKDINRHKDATAGSLGLMNDKAMTINTITKTNLPAKVPEG